MLWCIPGAASLIYYIALRTMAPDEQFTAVWLVCALLFFALFIRSIYYRHHPRGRAWPLRARTFCIATAVLFLTVAVVTGGRIVAGMSSDAQPGADYLIILSEIDIPGEDETELAGRLDCAAEYLTDNPETVVIVSGGWNISRGSTESQVMYQYLVRHGIDADRFYRETSGKNTRDNLAGCIELMGTTDASTVILSSDYFAYRALRTAKNLGMTTVRSLSSDTYGWLLPNRVMAEILWVLHDRLLLK